MTRHNSLRIAQAKLRAIASTERNLATRLANIEWRETELKEALDSIQKLAAAGHVPDIDMIAGGGILERLKQLTTGAPKAKKAKNGNRKP